MVRIPRHFRDSASSKIGTYEAFLDLLTLLCFIFMFAAAFYVERYSTARSGSASKVVSKEAVRGIVPETLQRGEVEFKLERTDGQDQLTILNSVIGQTNKIGLNITEFPKNLELMRPSLDSATNISIAIFDEAETVSPDVIVTIQRWLTYNGYGHYKFYFVRQR